MIKPSVFIQKVFPENQPYFLIYNHLTNAIARLPMAYSCYFEKCSIDFEEMKGTILNRLMSEGFLIKENVDEESLGRMQYGDSIYNRTLSITLLASEECNFRCKYCYENFSRGNMENWVVDAFNSYLRKNLARYGGLNFEWFGGEPLLAPDTIERISTMAVSLCQKLGIPFRAGITTNGYLLTPEMMKRMLKCRVRAFSITIDGIESCHDQTRQLRNGKPTFSIIINNLKKIRDNFRSGTFEILIRTNVTKSLIPYFEEYAQMLKSEFGNDSRFSFYFRPAGNWGGERVGEVKQNFINDFEEIYQPLLCSAVALNMDGNLHLLGNKRCDAANRNSIVLGSNGQLYKCTMLLDSPHNQLGHITATGCLEIDQNLLAQWVSPDEKKSDECENCVRWSLCHNRYCAARTFRQNNFNKYHCGYEENSIVSLILLLDKAKSNKIQDYVKM